MIKLGIVLLILGVATSISASTLFSDFAGIKYIQVIGFLMGVIGLFMMETNKRKRMKK
ncbi:MULTISPECIES: hypothetical protein [Bacillus]|uniref:hypothetical protein n=1 Tax=Bacillus TaxID=1386 RepID=UPI0002F428C7|nr:MULTISPECIES: hypothetical protein [Bacillus]